MLDGKYGFYDAVDYTNSRLKKGEKHAVVKTYMAHHQGLIMVSINNSINQNILQKRFNRNPEIESVNILLQEKMPVEMIITKEKKEKVSKTKLAADGVYIEKTINHPDKQYKNVTVISNENYKITINDFGEGMSEYKGKLVSNYKPTSELKNGIFFYIRNVKTKKIIKLEEADKVIFAPDKVKFIGRDANIEFEVTVTLDPNNSLEIRRVKIENYSQNDEILEVICEFEPCLLEHMSEYSHPAFNKLFLQFEQENENIIVRRKSRDLLENLYLATTLYVESAEMTHFEYEIDSEKYYGRENYGIPKILKNQRPFSNSVSQVTGPMIAMKRTVKVVSQSEATVNLLLSVSEEKDRALEILGKAKSEEEIVKILNVARARAEEQNKFLQIKGNKLELYQEFLNYILQLDGTACQEDNAVYAMDSFWKYGISGDLPIVILKIAKFEETYVLEDIIKAFEYYRIKNVSMDLVILNYEKNVYERFVEDNINYAISERQLGYLKNTSGGIFVINQKDISSDDLSAMFCRARVVIDAKNGDLTAFLKEKKEKKDQLGTEKVVKKQLILEPEELLPVKKQELLFDNEFGGFISNSKEYWIYKNKENKPPAVWANVLANQFFGSIVTDSFGGFTWYKNSKLNRLTAWNNNTVMDFPSEIYYLKDKNNEKTWTLNTSIQPNDNYYYIKHGFGYTTFENSCDNLIQTVDVFVPNEQNVKVMNFRIKNIINETRKIKVLAYFKPVLGEDEYLTNGSIKVSKKANVILAQNLFAEENFKDKIMYVTSSEPILSFTGDKSNFFGRGDFSDPDALYKSLDNTSGLGKNSCIGIEIELEIGKLEDKKFTILIGEEDKIEKVCEIADLYQMQENVEKSLIETRGKWNNIVNVVNVKTPSESINLMMNGWLVYQTITSRIFARSGYYQSGGAFGFRDQLQDCFGLKFVDSSFLYEQIINCSRHQFIEGDVLHWWHTETKKGIRTRFSDDLLWLVYGVLEYVEFTNKEEIFDEQTHYIKGDLLKENEFEKYDIFYESDVCESIFDHCVRAIEKVISKGIDPFPKIGIGDWNDGFSNLGSQGRGQSIWLGFFLYDILNRFIPYCEKRNRTDLSQKYTELKETLKRNLNTKAWDGRWYKRAINDDGIEIGSMNSRECRIDSIAQSWSVISDAGDNDKKFISMSEAENYLVDRENKIIKLFDPAFENSDFNPGYIKAYPVGIRENGGQYTHASVWMIMAEAILGFGDKAVEFAEMINPIEHSRTKEEAKRFKLEPYVMEADIYTSPDMLRTWWLELVYRFKQLVF